MKPWMKVQLSPAAISNGDENRLMTQFESIFITALAPLDAAVFQEIERVNGNHVFYFSPAAVKIFALLLSGWSPEECGRPSPESVLFRLGHADAMQLLTRS